MPSKGAQIGPMDAETANLLVSAASDLALIVNSDGIITDITVRQGSLTPQMFESWRGRPWQDTVTVESRPKIGEILRSAAEKTAPRWRHVNHLTPDSGDIPVAYTAVRVGAEGQSIAIGRDMRPLANMQQQLVSAQQTMERDYSRLRQDERRYRLLFHMAGDGLIVVDAQNRRVIEANKAAGVILSGNGLDLTGQLFPYGLDEGSERRMKALLDAVSLAGRADELPFRSRIGEDLVGSITLFRKDNEAFFLVRLQLADASVAARNAANPMLSVIERAPDGFVVTDPSGKILSINPAFVGMTELSSAGDLKGEGLERWLGRPGVDMKVLMTNLKEHGTIRNFQTVVAGEYGGVTEVEVSAVSVPTGLAAVPGLLDPGNQAAAAVRYGARHTDAAVRRADGRAGRSPFA
ncbi:MAG: transcriptional regulator PpsR [Minwuia sp.]|uniref:transcriptional regulator PpsR n=1 Tax=Minwuia sp. TaxID=2493630 RepID=UPI003A872900